MPSKHMLPKGQRRHSVRAEYRATRGVEDTAPIPIPVLDLEDLDPEEDLGHHPEASENSSADKIRRFHADPAGRKAAVAETE